MVSPRFLLQCSYHHQTVGRTPSKTFLTNWKQKKRPTPDHSTLVKKLAHAVWHRWGHCNTENKANATATSSVEVNRNKKVPNCRPAGVAVTDSPSSIPGKVEGKERSTRRYSERKRRGVVDSECKAVARKTERWDSKMEDIR